MRNPKKQIEDAYQRNAKTYDLAVKIIYPLIGLRIDDYRKKALEYLNLSEGDLVVDLGCGTGLCFPLLMDKIGPNGKVFGVDISTEMLSIAEKRVKSAGWSNIELVHSDIEEFDFPNEINGLISTGVFGYLEEPKNVLEKIHKSLLNSGKVVVIDGKYPKKWPSLLFKIFVKLSSPYGLTESYFNNDTSGIISRSFQNVTYEEMYGGLLYISSGEKGDDIA